MPAEPDETPPAGQQSDPAPRGHVTRLTYGERDIHLVGTAHVSRRSVEEVTRVIRELKPDTVCVELDAMRHEALLDEGRFRKLDIFQVIKERKTLFVLASLVLAAFQRRLGDRLGVRPGAELLAAIQTAEEVGARLVLADRDIQATLKRTWASLSFWNKAELSGALLGSFFGGDSITEEQIEELKDRDVLSDVMAELARQMPRLQVPLIEERDQFLMSMIQEAPGKIIVGVVGAGHVAGMQQALGKSVDRSALSTIPPPSLTSRIVSWSIPLVVLGAFFFGYRERSGEGLLHMVTAWVVPTFVGAGLFTALAGGALITVLATAFAAPLTTLNPLLGAGMIAAVVEAWRRRPTVADCEGINEAMLSLRGMYRNAFTRVLLVAAGATLGAMLGMYVGTAWIIKLL